jgi:exopolyphosphatase / guanosine-5'-triphosphate,3'-diphosphate pyrophosphatase
MSTTTITPRWEWRCFAPALAALAEAAAVPADAAPRDSDETYILDLTGRSAENVKIREDVLDVKRLLRTDFGGLELWAPVVKAPFPLAREDVGVVFAPWLPPAALARASYTFRQLVEAIEAAHASLRIVAVHKSRRGFTFAGCLAELAQIKAGPASVESFSLEHEEPQRLLAALATLGLEPRANTNYVRGLKRALGLEPT